MKPENNPPDAAELRARAEAALLQTTAPSPESLAALSPEATQRMLHELRLQQIEREMQNEEMRRAQLELELSRASYFDPYDLAPVGYLVVRESGLILQANLTAAAMLGEVRGALTNRLVSQSIFNADQDAYHLCRKRLVDTGEPQSCELRVMKPDGAHLWVLVAMSAACADDGTPLHRVKLTDIGESKRAKAAQRESEERLRVALAAAAAIGFVWDAASDAVVRYFSTVPSLPVNVDAPEPVAAVRARVHPDDVGQFDAGVAECLMMGTEYRNLYRVVDPDGSERWLQEWGTLSRDSAGRPLRLTGISIDVTERKLAQTKLLLADRALKNVSQGVIITGPDQMIVTVNAAFTAITGYSEREILGRNCRFLQGTGTDPVTVAAIRQALKDGNDFSGEILNYHKGGTPFWNELTISPARDPQGVLTHFIGITRDVTARKLAERELKARAQRLAALAEELTVTEQRVRRALAERLHDDLQQNLVAARFQLQRLLPELDASTLPVGAALDQTLAEALTTSRAITAELSPPVNITGDLPGALQWLRRFFKECYQLTVEVELEAAPGSLPEATATLVYTAARELLLNVVKHAEVDRATLSLRQSEGVLELQVSDAGKGCDPSASPARPGLGGFGLFSIRERTVLLGGTCSFDSAPGQGARLRLRIPLASLAPAAARLETPRLETPQEEIRLVVVDDHALVRESLIAALAPHARLRAVGQASNGLEALACVEQELPTVVLMDVNMPVMNGIEATRAIKQRWPAVRVIGLSLHDDPAVIASVLSAGADRHVNKGSGLSLLLQAIQECADEALAPDLAADSIMRV